MEHKKIKIPAKDPNTNEIVWGYLYADVYAQSAFDNDVTFDEFKASLDSFSRQSKSSLPQIQEWREEATEIFFDLLEKAGKLKFKPEDFLGESDCIDEDDGTTPDIDNKNLS